MFRFILHKKAILLSFLGAFILGTFTFLYSFEGGRYLDWFYLSPERSTSQIIRLTQAGYWVSPRSRVLSQNTKGSFDINLKEAQLVIDWISKRYSVDLKETELFVSAAYLAAHEIDMDPHLILAVMGIESSFNPNAESAAGAQGLMQVMTSVHTDRFEPHGGASISKDPIINIRVGSAILKSYISKTGSVKGGLKGYVGALALSHDYGYGKKVLAEYERLKNVARGKAIPTRSISI